LLFSLSLSLSLSSLSLSPPLHTHQSPGIFCRSMVTYAELDCQCRKIYIDDTMRWDWLIPCQSCDTNNFFVWSEHTHTTHIWMQYCM
jgi:hypothetical protein